MANLSAIHSDFHVIHHTNAHGGKSVTKKGGEVKTVRMRLGNLEKK